MTSKIGWLVAISRGNSLRFSFSICQAIISSSSHAVTVWKNGGLVLVMAENALKRSNTIKSVMRRKTQCGIIISNLELDSGRFGLVVASIAIFQKPTSNHNRRATKHYMKRVSSWHTVTKGKFDDLSLCNKIRPATSTPSKSSGWRGSLHRTYVGPVGLSLKNNGHYRHYGTELFFFSKNQFLRVLTLSHKNVGSSLDHLAAVFYSQKTQDCVIRSSGPKPGKKMGKLTSP